ncbi:MAG: RNA degradosome polyphosphate kinase [Lachnospiraceae bacterium]|nr:RNA degradosome polyphosphate kinase [Lachnospiraceae bacterium]
MVETKNENKKDFTKYEYYRNRELSWLAFNERVLSEAKDKTIPLLERCKFLGITASNLDEFIMVRVASLKDQVSAGYEKPDIAGMNAKEQLDALMPAIHEFTEQQYQVYNRSLLPALKKAGIEVITAHEDLTPEQGAVVDKYFMESVYPVLTPMAVDPSRPFPLVRNKSLNIAVLLQYKKEKKEDKKGEKGEKGEKNSGKGSLLNHAKEVEFVTVQVPSVLPRIFRLPEKGCKLILLEEIIERNIGKLFLNYDIMCAHPYRVMRNSDLAIDEEEAVDLLRTIEKQLKKRAWGEVIRLEVQADMDKRLLKYLKKEFNIHEEDIFKINGPLDITMMSKISGAAGDEFAHLKDPKHVPQPIPQFQNDDDIFTNIRKGDILMHHPYQTFDNVVDFVRQAANDPTVLAIKQTLYRVSGNSPIIAALAKAAENGKQVTVLVELKARFDEENNIHWAKKLERAGCHVIYGLLGLKTHCKITLVVRMEEDGIRRYVHLGTGNYNDSTAKLYTDTGLMTCNEKIGEDATAVFNMLSGYSEPLYWNALAVAPLWLKDKFLYLIGRERDLALEGKPARIVAKMNSLSDPVIIRALYEASSAGVKIDLIVRGICCLKTGIPGVSENITVRSIVGTFLEHSRIYYFLNNGAEEVYMASADWMPRNLDRRVEIMFPVEDPALKEEVKEILRVTLADNLKARFLQPDGSYEKVDRRGKIPFCAQDYFVTEAAARVLHPEKTTDTRRFIPMTAFEDNQEGDNDAD